ncbi:MAG: DEAD/DEAH box helicase [Clostridiaceae bacterium]|nr:DEAD/DEAH box helicase [Clostridiaceae bacterium]
MNFHEMGLLPEMIRNLDAMGYTEATPIQEQSIPVLLSGRDLLGCAQTGTGKTAAFALPIIQKLVKEQTKGRRRIRTLVLAPTRELALQINDCFRAYAKHSGLRSLVVFGGVSQVMQVKGLREGIDILVATPGRLLDLMNQGFINLNEVRHFVLDEADRMLDMGMIHDVRRIVSALPEKRQTMFFSATMPTEIEELSTSILSNPHYIEIAARSSAAETVNQAVFRVDKKNKVSLLIHLLQDESIDSALVFSRTKHGADKIVSALEKAGLSAQSIHGNKSQSARQNALNNFKRRKTRILVATDIAARGIDVAELSHVFQFDLPEVPETYVHRIGRTGRAGLGGTAIAFCGEDEYSMLRGVQKLIGKELYVENEHPFPMLSPEVQMKRIQPFRTQRQDQGRGQGFRPNNRAGGRPNNRGKAPRSKHAFAKD